VADGGVSISFRCYLEEHNIFSVIIEGVDVGFYFNHR
jgi:hypothetical protein